MKFKALVSGTNQSVIDEFFEKMIEIEIMTSSIRHQDIAAHIKYFRPDVFYIVFIIRRRISLMKLQN